MSPYYLFTNPDPDDAVSVSSSAVIPNFSAGGSPDGYFCQPSIAEMKPKILRLAVSFRAVLVLVLKIVVMERKILPAP